MSDLANLFALATEHGLLLSSRGDKLVVRSVTGTAVPRAFRDLLATHKAAILANLAYRDEALAIVTESLSRLAADFPLGCDIDTAEGRRLDAAITEAFWSGDLDALATAVGAYEQFARERSTTP